MGFGERLQREREMRHITLDEIAKATKIGSRSLRALEEEDFDKLPGGIFNKGFVRAYARYLGIDEDQAVADYLKAIGEPTDPALDNERLKKLESSWQAHKESAARAPVRIPWLGVVLILVLAVVLFTGWHYRRQAVERIRGWRARGHHSGQQTSISGPANPTLSASPRVSASPSAATDLSPPSAQAPAGATAAATPPLPVQPALHPGQPVHELVLQIRALEDSWISVAADGHSVYRGILKATSQTSVRARKKIMFTAGNAGGVELLLNDKALPKLGDTGQVRTVLITLRGLEPQYPQPRP